MIKRLSVGIVFTIILSGFISAQTLSIGPIVGANFMTISNTPSSKKLVGLSIGAFANYSINEHLGTNLKLLFSQMGTATDNSAVSVRLNYIHIPLSVVYFFGNAGNKIRPKLFIGPYASFLLNASDKNGNNIVFPNGNDVYLKTDFGGILGGGFNYLIKSRTWLNIDANYSTSFSSIVDATNSDNKNKGFQFNVGISFPIGSK